MKKLTAITGAMCLLFAASAYSATVDADDWKRLGASYGRSDGWYEGTGSRIPAFMENAHPTYGQAGATYVEDFNYGDGLGMVCDSGIAGSGIVYSLGTGTNDACDDTCDELSPPQECVIGHDGTSFIVCSGTSADTCICAAPAVPDTDCANTLQTGQMRSMQFGEGVTLMAYAIGATTATANMPDMDASSLDIAGDQADDEGIDIFGGMYGASGRPFVIGDDPAFQFCATTAMADADGSDDFHVGFRLVQPPTDVFDDLTDFATIGYVADEGTTAAITIETDAAGSGTTTTDTTQSNSTSAIKLCVLVSAAGVAEARSSEPITM